MVIDYFKFNNQRKKLNSTKLCYMIIFPNHCRVLGKELETEPEANSYIFFGNDDGYDGPGFAPTKTTCSPTKSSRIAIVEYYTIDTATAGVGGIFKSKKLLVFSFKKLRLAKRCLL